MKPDLIPLQEASTRLLRICAEQEGFAKRGGELAAFLRGDRRGESAVREELLKHYTHVDCTDALWTEPVRLGESAVAAVRRALAAGFKHHRGGEPPSPKRIDANHKALASGLKALGLQPLLCNPELAIAVERRKVRYDQWGFIVLVGPRLDRDQASLPETICYLSGQGRPRPPSA